MCPDQYPGACYRYVVKPTNYSRAQQFCAKSGGTVVTYASLMEQSSVEGWVAGGRGRSCTGCSAVAAAVMGQPSKQGCS